MGLSLPDCVTESSRTVAINLDTHFEARPHSRIPVRDQIDARYQAAEDDGTPSTQESTCHLGSQRWACWKPLDDLCPLRPTALAYPSSANSCRAASRDAGLGGQVVRCAKNSRSAAAIVSGLP